MDWTQQTLSSRQSDLPESKPELVAQSVGASQVPGWSDFERQGVPEKSLKDGREGRDKPKRPDAGASVTELFIGFKADGSRMQVITFNKWVNVINEIKLKWDIIKITHRWAKI